MKFRSKRKTLKRKGKKKKQECGNIEAKRRVFQKEEWAIISNDGRKKSRPSR